MASPALEHAFDAVISAAHRVLKPRGYAKRGACFRRGIDGNYVIVQFQKSAWNAHDCLKFTVNFGVLSSALAAREAQAPSKIFDAAKCHMTARIGNFRSSSEDLWWTLDGADPGTLISEALVLIERGAAHFEDVASDRALAGLWRTRKGILTADGRSVMRAALASLPDTPG